MLDPHTSATLTLDKIWGLCDDLIAAHQQAGLLGEFQPTVRGTGRSAAGISDRIIAHVEPELGRPLDENAETFRLQVSVTNPTAAEAEVPLSVRSRAHSVEVEGKAAFTLRVPAGATVREPFTVRRNGNGHTNGAAAGNGAQAADEIELSSTSKAVFARGWMLLPRKVLTADGSGPAVFELSLAGFPAATGSVRVDGARLVWNFEVNDSDIRPGPAPQPFIGSCIELFLDDEKGAGPQQVILVPACGLKPGESGQASIVNARGDAVPGAVGTCELSGAGYRLSAALPLVAVRWVAGMESLLFDVLITIQALGDAHSGGRAALNGSFDSWNNTSHYARLNVVG